MSEEKKLKTMNEIPAADAVNWFSQFLDDPDGIWFVEPPWFAEVAARDFLECLKMFTDALRPSIPYVPFSDDQRQELANIPDEQMRKLLTEAEYEVMRLLMEGNTILNIAYLRGKADKPLSRKTIESQKNSALMKLTVAGYKVTVPKELAPWKEDLS